MKRIYFVCMGNYYRSRLAEELAVYYAAQYEVEIQVDSGGLTDIEHSNNVGPIASSVLRYLAAKNIQPRGARRYPKPVTADDVYASDIVVCTDADEQLHLFQNVCPEFSGKLVTWRARDQHYDPLLQTPFMIDKNVEALIKELSER